MQVSGPNNVWRAVETDPTLLHYASEQNVGSCCLKHLTAVSNFAQQLPTTRNNMSFLFKKS